MKYIDDMPWQGKWPWSKRCKARLKKGKDPEFHGRCDLAPHDEFIDHCLERGMIWVRWNQFGIRYEQPEYRMEE